MQGREICKLNSEIEMKEQMRYIIFGAGGIGGGIGGHLWRTEKEVILIGRQGHVDRIRQNGLQLIRTDDTYNLKIPAVTHPSAVQWKENDVILLCIKSQDTEEALKSLFLSGVDPEIIPIFCCQNSITNEPAATRYFRRVYGVMVNVPGIYLEDGVVYNPVTENAGYLEIGAYPKGIDGLAKHVIEDLREASYGVSANENVMAAKGTKMMGNLSNALGAITDGKGDVERFRTRVQEEGRQCFQAAGLPLDERSALSARSQGKRGKTQTPEGMRNLGSSWQSLTRKQGTIEADYLNGEIVRLGIHYGIGTPFNRILQLVAGRMASDHEMPGKYTADELYAMAEESVGLSFRNSRLNRQSS